MPCISWNPKAPVIGYVSIRTIKDPTGLLDSQLEQSQSPRNLWPFDNPSLRTSQGTRSWQHRVMNAAMYSTREGEARGLLSLVTRVAESDFISEGQPPSHPFHRLCSGAPLWPWGGVERFPSPP